MGVEDHHNWTAFHKTIGGLVEQSEAPVASRAPLRQVTSRSRQQQASFHGCSLDEERALPGHPSVDGISNPLPYLRPTSYSGSAQGDAHQNLEGAARLGRALGRSVRSVNFRDNAEVEGPSSINRRSSNGANKPSGICSNRAIRRATRPDLMQQDTTTAEQLGNYTSSDGSRLPSRLSGNLQLSLGTSAQVTVSGTLDPRDAILSRVRETDTSPTNSISPKHSISMNDDDSSPGGSSNRSDSDRRGYSSTSPTPQLLPRLSVNGNNSVRSSRQLSTPQPPIQTRSSWAISTDAFVGRPAHRIRMPFGLIW